MKLKIWSCLFALYTVAVHSFAQELDPEMTGEEYRSLFAQMEKSKGFRQRIANDPLHFILELGKRNLDWIEIINSTRDSDNKLQLTTPETTQAYPIDNPGISSPSIIMNQLDSLKKSMPQAMLQVLFSTVNLPNNPLIDDEIFINNARAVNHIYEAASRWLMQEPYLEWMKSLAQFDIRGYYFLQRESNLNYKLNHWQTLDDVTQKKYSEWLISECNNTQADKILCEKLLANAIDTQQVSQFHLLYVDNAKKVFNNFFELQNPRPEVIWDYNNSDLMIMPFMLPEEPAVQNWLKTNVEDEFHLNQWSLKINYSIADNLAKVIFVPGATPHVDYLGGDTITMDANRNLNDYAITWTIRHEFAHVLGFPDCYVEFYDAQQEVMVNYQIDISNLMCSRRGHLQQKHYDELAKNYYKSNLRYMVP